MSIDREPGFYEADAGAVAVLDQQRAGMIDALRTTHATSVTVFQPDDSALHWAFCLPRTDSGKSNSSHFLIYALARAWRDAIAAIECDDDTLGRILRDVRDAGIGL